MIQSFSAGHWRSNAAERSPSFSTIPNTTRSGSASSAFANEAFRSGKSSAR
jgi:hypothetical protein